MKYICHAVLMAALLIGLVYAQSTQTLGVISNQYGLWDDVNLYINKRFIDPSHAKAIRQLAFAIQNALINGDSEEKGQKLTQTWFRALSCVSQKLGEAGYYESKRLTAEILNSEARSRAYVRHEKYSAGGYSLEEDHACDD